jgi:hypothetical protein
MGIDAQLRARPQVVVQQDLKSADGIALGA